MSRRAPIGPSPWRLLQALPLVALLGCPGPRPTPAADAEIRVSGREVRFPAVVSAGSFGAGDSEMSGYHLIVWDAGGASGEALFRTPVSDLAVLEALESLGAVPGDALTRASWNRRRDRSATEPDRVIEGPPVEILVEVPGVETPLKPGDYLEDPGGRGVRMRFGGHRANRRAWHSGCVACLFSCPGSKIGNAAYTIRDFVDGTTRFAVRPGVLPADGTRVEIVLRLPDPERLARELIIVDTHVDVPYRLAEGDEDISVTAEGGDFDYPRAIAGGLDAPFMSIYVAASFQKTGGARQEADRLIDLVEGLAERWPEKFAIVRSPAEVRRLHGSGRIALPLGMENGAPVEDDLANLAHFHERGIRYITLAHSENNLICDSSYADEKEWHGLSPFGREVVAEMNRLGIMVDVSHVSDESFYEILEISRAPVIASHSSCRHFTPGWERNMDDEMIRALAAAGGVIQINFGSAFLTAASNERSQATWDEIDGFAEEHGLDESSPEVEAFAEAYRSENPPILADVTDVADHIDHVVALVGVDHVGIGSDFDGVGETTPTGLEDVSRFPNLIRELLNRGYDESELAKILGENTLRVWAEVERIAAEG